MAGFKTHISVSTVAGIGYATAGYFLLDVPPPTAIVSAGFCAIAGILPDVDSDSGKPVQEVMGFAAAVLPLLLLERLRQWGLDRDSLVAAGVCIYVLVRFGVGEILRRLTVHRGMWHSLPAVALAAMITLLLCAHESPSHRWFKVGAVTLGYLVHLSLDELYSVEWYRGRLRLKKSSGTAIKIWGESLWANVFTFANLALLTYVLLYHPPGRPELVPQSEGIRSVPWEANQSFPSNSDRLERR